MILHIPQIMYKLYYYTAPRVLLGFLLAPQLLNNVNLIVYISTRDAHAASTTLDLYRIAHHIRADDHSTIPRQSRPVHLQHLTLKHTNYSTVH